MKSVLLLSVAMFWQAGQVKSPSAPSPFEAKLAAIDSQAKDIQTLTAEFKQLKYTTLLKTPMESNGTVRIKNDGPTAIVRWDATTPVPSSMAVTSRELKIYYPRQALLEIYPLEHALAQLAASPVPDMDMLRKQFTIEEWKSDAVIAAEKTLPLRLTPLDDLVREHVQEVRLFIETGTGCIAAAEIIYPDQDRLIVSFSEIQLNRPIKEDELDLRVPAGTTITHPLGPTSQTGVRP